MGSHLVSTDYSLDLVAGGSNTLRAQLKLTDKKFNFAPVFA